MKQLIEKHFVLYTQPGADPDTEVKWNEIDWEVEGSNGNFTLKLENAVYYTINNEVVHYYLLANSEMGGTIPINEDWPGNDQGDSYRIEYDNHDNPNVGTVTDKVYSGGTLVLTREGTVEYNATKIWITPENRKKIGRTAISSCTATPIRAEVTRPRLRCMGWRRYPLRVFKMMVKSFLKVLMAVSWNSPNMTPRVTAMFMS